ncbi:MAG: CHASE domain-containing protein [Deltaproteobacteria bacterium]
MTKKKPHLTTSALLGSTNTALRNWPLAWIVLAVGLLITAAATLYMKSSVEIIANVEFTADCNEIKNNILNRLDDHARILLSGAALFNASETVSREEWRVFNKAQKVEKQLPGIQGIGFALLIPPAELSRHIQRIRREGFPQYKLRPDGVREIYSSIIYLEPFSGRNLRAFGYDMFSEPVRRSAMERARDTDTAALSGKVVLVQETDKEVQFGTLMYVPVYHKGMPIETLEQRRAAIYGWVYSPYRMNDLMQGIIGNRNLGKENQLHFQVFDGAQPSIQSLLYDSQPKGDQKLRPDAQFNRQIPVDFNGQRWTLRFTQTSGSLATMDYISVWITLVSGIIISLLLFSLILALLTTRTKAHLAENLAAQQRETKEYLENLIDYANVPIVVWNPQFHIIRFNHAFESITGRVSGDVLGNNLEILFPPDLVENSMEHIKRTPLGEHWESLEINIQHANGSVRTVLWNSATIFAEDGTTPIATIAQGSDITDRKWAEEKIKASLLEKELLLKEIHHRVKNNLQIISSLLNLQTRYVRDEKMEGIFQECQNRITAIASVHALLYKSENFTEIDFGEYMRKMANQLFRSYTTGSMDISLVIQAENVLLPIDTAIPCGLIINELVTNALKHAFPQKPGKGEIKIAMNRTALGIKLLFEDNGIGFPKSADFYQSETFGVKLVHLLVKQLDGSIEQVIDGGTKYTIIFKTTMQQEA